MLLTISGANAIIIVSYIYAVGSSEYPFGIKTSTTKPETDYHVW